MGKVEGGMNPALRLAFSLRSFWTALRQRWQRGSAGQGLSRVVKGCQGKDFWKPGISERQLGVSLGSPMITYADESNPRQLPFERGQGFSLTRAVLAQA